MSCSFSIAERAVFVATLTSSIAAVTQRIARVFRQVMIADALAGRSDYFAPMWGETAVEAKSVSDWGFL